jgi:hypothetical protein
VKIKFNLGLTIVKPEFSDTVKELIIKSRIVSFDRWASTHDPEIIQIFQTADNDRSYLTAAQLTHIAAKSPHTSQLIPIVRQIDDRKTEIIDRSRERVLAHFPTITQPGGGLYPPERAQACWRDFWQFLRCITYGLAGGSPEYTSDAGLEYMRQLYRELAVPLEAMVVGLEGLKIYSIEAIDPSDTGVVVPYFDVLIAKLRSFQSIDR